MSHQLEFDGIQAYTCEQKNHWRTSEPCTMIFKMVHPHNNLNSDTWIPLQITEYPIASDYMVNEI